MAHLVFVDSSEFVAANFYFAGGRLKTLLSYVAAGSVVLGLPVITRNELHAHIRRQMESATASLRATRKDHRVLRLVKAPLTKALYDEFDGHGWADAAIQDLDTALKGAKVVDLGFAKVDAGHVFELYFGGMPPFGSADKKCEFPDAFALAIASAWGEREQSTVLVVSSDGDMEEGADRFPNLEYVGDLRALITRLAREEDGRLATQATKHFEALSKAIERDIAAEFQNFGFYVDDQDGDVIDVTVESVSLEFGLARIEDNEGTITAHFDVTAVVNFLASITYDDMDTAIYDHEDGRAYPLHQIDDEVTRDDEFDLSVAIVFSKPAGAKPSFTLDLPMGHDVAVTAILDEDLD